MKWRKSFVKFVVWCPWSWGRALALQYWGPEFDSGSGCQLWDFFIGPHIWREYWRSCQEAEPREICISSKNLFLNLCKINIFKLKLQGKGRKGLIQTFALSSHFVWIMLANNEFRVGKIVHCGWSRSWMGQWAIDQLQVCLLLLIACISLKNGHWFVEFQ